MAKKDKGEKDKSVAASASDASNDIQKLEEFASAMEGVEQTVGSLSGKMEGLNRKLAEHMGLLSVTTTRNNDMKKSMKEASDNATNMFNDTQGAAIAQLPKVTNGMLNKFVRDRQSVSTAAMIASIKGASADAQTQAKLLIASANSQFKLDEVGARSKANLKETSRKGSQARSTLKLKHQLDTPERELRMANQTQTLENKELDSLQKKLNLYKQIVALKEREAQQQSKGKGGLLSDDNIRSLRLMYSGYHSLSGIATGRGGFMGNAMNMLNFYSDSRYMKEKQKPKGTQNTPSLTDFHQYLSSPEGKSAKSSDIFKYLNSKGGSGGKAATGGNVAKAAGGNVAKVAGGAEIAALLVEFGPLLAIGGLIIGVVAGITKLAVEANQIALKIEQSSNTLGGSFKQASEYAKDMSDSLGVSLDRTLAMMGATAGMFKDTGMSNATSGAYAKNVNKMANDLAAYQNISMEDATQKINSYIKGADNMSDIGFMGDQGMARGFAQEHMGISMAVQPSDARNAQIRQQYLQYQMQNMFANGTTESMKMNQQWQEIGNTMDQAGKNFKTFFLPALKTAEDLLLGMAKKWEQFSEFFAKLHGGDPKMDEANRKQQDADQLRNQQWKMTWDLLQKSLQTLYSFDEVIGPVTPYDPTVDKGGPPEYNSGPGHDGTLPPVLPPRLPPDPTLNLKPEVDASTVKDVLKNAITQGAHEGSTALSKSLADAIAGAAAGAAAGATAGKYRTQGTGGLGVPAMTPATVPLGYSALADKLNSQGSKASSGSGSWMDYVTSEGKLFDPAFWKRYSNGGSKQTLENTQVFTSAASWAIGGGELAKAGMAGYKGAKAAQKVAQLGGKAKGSGNWFERLLGIQSHDTGGLSLQPHFAQVGTSAGEFTIPLGNGRSRPFSKQLAGEITSSMGGGSGSGGGGGVTNVTIHNHFAENGNLMMDNPAMRKLTDYMAQSLQTVGRRTGSLSYGVR